VQLAGRLACPVCRHHPLTDTDGSLECPSCGRRFECRDGVPDLLYRAALPPASLRMIADWQNAADQYRGMLAGIGPERLGPIDEPLLAYARGDVVEVGCGDGRLLRRVGGPAVRWAMGVEPSQPLASAAVAQGLAVVRGAAEQLPLPDASFDTVLAGYYALRYADLDLSLVECARVLRRGGRLGFTLLGRRAVALAGRLAAILLLPDRRRTWSAARLLFGEGDGANLPSDVEGAADLTTRLERAGFEVVELFGTPYVPILAALAARLSGRSLPYLRGSIAARYGFDVIVLARRR
jgi:SAM-dependent methyltransferase